jgi:hypothetical protein
MPAPLSREQAIEGLVEAESEIRALGVQRLALFGSVARSEARIDSETGLRSRRYRRSLGRIYSRKRKMFFAPREYLRHIWPSEIPQAPLPS